MPADCPYEFDKRLVAWVCPQCEREYPGVSEPPPRNCPKSPDAIADTRARVWERIEDRRIAGLSVVPNREVVARLDRCVACESFAGDRCGDIRGCDSPEKWIRRIASGTCEGWR